MAFNEYYVAKALYLPYDARDRPALTTVPEFFARCDDRHSMCPSTPGPETPRGPVPSYPLPQSPPSPAAPISPTAAEGSPRAALPPYVLAIDPDPESAKHGRRMLNIPIDQVVETRALHRFLQNQKPTPSLCLHFQKGTCRPGRLCNQLHCAPENVTSIRHVLSQEAANSCCALHRDHQLAQEDTLQRELRAREAAGLQIAVVSLRRSFPVPAERLVTTVALEEMVMKSEAEKGPRQNMLALPVSLVCRLHQLNRCTYNGNCRHVHVCREWMRLDAELSESILQTPKPPPILGVGPSLGFGVGAPLCPAQPYSPLPVVHWCSPREGLSPEDSTYSPPVSPAPVCQQPIGALLPGRLGNRDEAEGDLDDLMRSIFSFGCTQDQDEPPSISGGTLGLLPERTQLPVY